MYFCLRLPVLLFCFLGISCESEEQRRNILIFGGNGLLGAPTTERLIKSGLYSITLVSRGTWYWDTRETIRPHVAHISCDRFQSLEKCPEFMQKVNDSDQGAPYFDAVVDFSAYHPFQLTHSTTALRGKVGVYVYISSDSVYEVCNKTHSDFSREEDSVRPEDEETAQKWAESDDYGHRKLQGEDELARQRADGGIPYITLRLPDVIGPRDNTQRLWIYQLWIRLSDFLQRPLSVPTSMHNQPVRMVFSEDVADLIQRLVTPREEWLDQAYNLGFHETTNLRELVTFMKVELDRSDLNVQLDSGPDPLYLIPSVRKGPVDITKAVKILGWSPTSSWRDVVRRIVNFHEDAIKNEMFDSERQAVVRTMQRYFTKEPFRVSQGLRKVYNVDLKGNNRDEL